VLHGAAVGEVPRYSGLVAVAPEEAAVPGSSEKFEEELLSSFSSLSSSSSSSPSAYKVEGNFQTPIKLSKHAGLCYLLRPELF